MHIIDVIDSHTAGEPTRVVLSGFPDLGDGDLAQCRDRFRSEFDQWRSAIACEPRGSDTMVGALLLPPRDQSACTGVIFFNNVGYLACAGTAPLEWYARLPSWGASRRADTGSRRR